MEGFHCTDPFWGQSVVNEQLRVPERFPIKGIGKSGFNINLEKCKAEQSSVARATLSLPTGVEHTEENQVRIDLEGFAQRLKAQKGKTDPPLLSGAPHCLNS